MLRDAAKRIVVAVSMLLDAAAACVILLFFAAENRKSYWNVCIKAAKVICQQILSILKCFFPFKNPFKKYFKIVFWSLRRGDPVLELQFPTPLHVVLLCFAIQFLQIAL